MLQRRATPVRPHGLSQSDTHEVLVDLPHVEDESADVEIAHPLLERVARKDQVSQVQRRLVAHVQPGGDPLRPAVAADQCSDIR